MRAVTTPVKSWVGLDDSDVVVIRTSSGSVRESFSSCLAQPTPNAARNAREMMAKCCVAFELFICEVNISGHLNIWGLRIPSAAKSSEGADGRASRIGACQGQIIARH